MDMATLNPGNDTMPELTLPVGVPFDPVNLLTNFKHVCS
jgi:hypothetical protein